MDRVLKGDTLFDFSDGGVAVSSSRDRGWVSVFRDAMCWLIFSGTCFERGYD